MNTNIFISDIPKEKVLEKKTFRLLCSQIHHRGHFYGIFEINNTLFVVDDLQKACTKLSDSNKANWYPVVASMFFFVFFFCTIS